MVRQEIGMTIIVWLLTFSMILESAYGSKLQPNPNADNSIPELSQSWIPLEPSDAFRYFTKPEVCRAFRNRPHECGEKASNIYLSHSEKCSFTSRRSKQLKSSKYLQCPILESSFFRHLTSTIDSFNLIDAVYVMIAKLRRNRLVFIGDSVTRQHIDNSFCDLSRYGFQVDDTNPERYFIRLKSGMIFGNRSISSKDLSGFKEKKFFLDLILMQPSFWPNINWPRVQSMIEAVPPRSSVVIMNMGLHLYYPNPDVAPMYERHYEELFNFTAKTLLNNTSQQLVFYRESSAQHYASFDGSFFQAEVLSSDGKDTIKGEKAVTQPSSAEGEIKKHSFEYRCTPFQNTQAIVHQYWRNAMAIKVLRKLKLLSAMSFSQFIDATGFSSVWSDKLPLNEYPSSFSVAQQYYAEAKAQLASLRNGSSKPTSLPVTLSAVKSKPRTRLSRISVDAADYHLKGYEGITLLSFYLETAARYDLHISNTDCSLFCSSPMLWLPIWHQLTMHLEAISSE